MLLSGLFVVNARSMVMPTSRLDQGHEAIEGLAPRSGLPLPGIPSGVLASMVSQVGTAGAGPWLAADTRVLARAEIVLTLTRQLAYGNRARSPGDAPVVKRISHRSPEPGVRVRFAAGADLPHQLHLDFAKLFR